MYNLWQLDDSQLVWLVCWTVEFSLLGGIFTNYCKIFSVITYIPTKKVLPTNCYIYAVTEVLLTSQHNAKQNLNQVNNGLSGSDCWVQSRHKSHLSINYKKIYIS
jgi:hypothetical protein